MKPRREMPSENGLNLAPILNLVMILIPLLLISIEFEQLGVINVSSPGFVKPITEVAPPPLNLTVAITHTGFQIAARGETLDPVARKDAVGDPEPSRYDFATLYERILAIKQANPDETTLSLSADEDIPYEMVITTMDSVRYLRGEERAELFPDVTLAIIQ